MGLVGYSDSEGSGDESPELGVKPPVAAANGAGKPKYQKLVDKSNPRKIMVNLSTTNASDSVDDIKDEDTPPTKRQKLGGGLSGFNAMLPAPKRAAPAGSGPRKGVSLKTGAEPAFSRQPEPVNEHIKEAPAPSTEEAVSAAPPAEIKATGSAMRFKPLSVARKPQRRKATVAALAAGASSAKDETAKMEPKVPRVSLFNMDTSNEREQASAAREAAEEARNHQAHQETLQEPVTHSSTPGSNQADAGGDTLDSIASDLNLSASARRQLLGRGGKGADVKITKFNVDAEYAANEAMRKAGEQQEQQTVRAIAPGKHSLRQLVNQVAGQKEALEDQFASGRRNKKEAGSKYGW